MTYFSPVGLNRCQPDFATKIVYLHVLSFRQIERNISDDMQPAFDDSTDKKTHQTVGVISFGIAIITGFISLLLFIVSLIPESGTYTAQRFTNIFFVFA